MQTAVLPTSTPLHVRLNPLLFSNSSAIEDLLVKVVTPFCYYKKPVTILSINHYYYFKFSLSYFKLLYV